MSDEENSPDEVVAEEKPETPEAGSEAESESPDSEQEVIEEKEIDYDLVKSDLEGFGDIKLNVTAVIGKVNMPVEQFLKLNKGAIIEIGKHKDEYVDLFVNEKYVARGDIKIIDDTKVGVEIQEAPIIEI